MKKLSLLVLAVLMLVLPLFAAISPAQADTATFLQRETNNLQGWYDLVLDIYWDLADQTHYCDTNLEAFDLWRAQSATAVALATLYRRAGDTGAAQDAKTLLDHVHAGTRVPCWEGAQEPLADAVSSECDGFDRGQRGQIMLNWVVAYDLLYTGGYMSRDPNWDQELQKLGDAWAGADPCPGENPNVPNKDDTDAEENAPFAAFLAVMEGVYPSYPDFPDWYTSSNKLGFHTSTYVTTDFRKYTTGYGFTSNQLHDDTGQVPPYYDQGLATANRNVYTDNPRYSMYALGTRGMGTVIHRRLTGFWGPGELDRHSKRKWFPWAWHETRIPEGDNDWGDTAEFYCGFDSNLVEDRDEMGVRADPSSAMAAAYIDVRFGTNYTDAIEPFLPQTVNDFKVPLDEEVVFCDTTPPNMLREHQFYRELYPPHPANREFQYLVDSVLMGRVGYAVIAKDTGVTMSPIPYP